jgi:hypothetical protein
MEDRNKTYLTHKITKATGLWLHEMGFKPVETEVFLQNKWIADLAGAIEPTRTELINLKLMKRSPNYSSTKMSEESFRAMYAEWYSTFNAFPKIMTVLVEVKTARNDFIKDSKWNRVSPTNLQYLAIPKGIIAESEYPKDWGIILFSEDGEEIEKVITPTLHFMIKSEQQIRTLYQIGIRRDHRTRYAIDREMKKSVRIEEIETKSITRIQTAIHFVLHIVSGKTIDEAKLWAGIRINIPKYLMEELEDLQKKVQTK